jgi:hypothetical protein
MKTSKNRRTYRCVYVCVHQEDSFYCVLVFCGSFLSPRLPFSSASPSSLENPTADSSLLLSPALRTHSLTVSGLPSVFIIYPFLPPSFHLYRTIHHTHTHTGISELFSFFPPPLLCALQSCVVQHGPTKHKGHEATPCWSTRDQRRDRPAPAWCPPNRRERHGVAANLRRYRPPRRPESHEQR